LKRNSYDLGTTVQKKEKTFIFSTNISTHAAQVKDEAKTSKKRQPSNETVGCFFDTLRP